VIPIARSRDVRNPADDEIMKFRKEGLEVPKELLEKKHSFNRARHERDIRKQHDFLKAKYDAQQALLADIAEINRKQAEQGLPTISSSVASTGLGVPVSNDAISASNSYVAGKILRPPGQGASKPFMQNVEGDAAR